MIKYSIKTVDGNRYDFTRPDGEQLAIDSASEWLIVNSRDGVTRMFLRKNIVSITSCKEPNA